MSRKIIRNGLRREAEIRGVKQSTFVHNVFEKYQIMRFGKKIRRINEAKGTHPKRTWKNRILSVVQEETAMCQLCRRSPCDSRCPNSSSPVVAICYFCDTEIYEGDDYYRIGDRDYCEDCITDCRKTAEVDYDC